MASELERSSTPPSIKIGDQTREPLPTDSMVTVPLSDLQPSPRGPLDRDSKASQLESISILDCSEESVTEIGKMASENGIRSQMASKTSSKISSAPSMELEDVDENMDLEDSRSVDWVELEKTEEIESKSGPPDNASTALLLARLEQENNALATDPKSAITGTSNPKYASRPPSIQQLKKLVNDPRSSLRYSLLPTPQMTELEFWAALVADYPRTAQRLPTLTSNKIRSGVPPPLRGVVWPSIAGARDMALQEEFEKLSGESSPYEGLIGKDIGRSFPNVEMFRDPNGEGQQMLAKVLKCFSLHDTKIGYCQGLGFVVGPLLMHMTEAEAFCVLVRLMDHYDLRSCFLPTLYGLHLRIYQFQMLLSRHLPALHAHLEELNVEPVYVSQWFLSFYAVTCPLPMLLRIYDVLLLEGACETLMRVALSLMQRNEKRLLACHEFEDVMQLLLSRTLWDPFSCNADDLVNDFVSLSSLVTRDSLQQLEASYKESQASSSNVYLPQLQAAASRFLGRLWAGSNSHNSSKSLVLPSGSPFSPPVVHRTPSKQSMASTLNSFESTSDASTALTDVSSDSGKRRAKPSMQNKDKDLHSQIEDLLIALTDMQREHATLAKDLQKEREERDEDQQLARLMLGYIKDQPEDERKTELISKANDRFSSFDSRRLSMQYTKQQLRDDVAQWRDKYEIEVTRCQNLGRTIDERERENTQLKEQLRETRGRVQDAYRDKQRLERTIHDLRSRKPSSATSDRPQSILDDDRASTTGLREFKLGKSPVIPTINTSTPTHAPSPKTPTFSKRTSSLGAPTFASPGKTNSNEDSLLAELVNAKTSEAVARQELEEVKAKLENLRKLVSKVGMGVSTTTPSAPPPTENNHLLSGWGSLSTTPRTPGSQTTSAATSASSGGGGFFSGWTRRTPSSGNISMSESR